MKMAATKKLKKSELPYDLGHILNHARRVLYSPMLDDVEQEVRRIAKAYLRKLQRHGHAYRQGSVEKSRRLEYLLCTSYGARIVSFLIGYPKNAPKISWTEVKTKANLVCPRIPSHQPVTVTGQKKPEGGIRTIQIFGPISRANQSLVRDMVATAMGYSPFEYARKGKGREKLMEDINTANRSKGVRSLGVADVENFYPSLKVETVRNVIKLSKAVIEGSVFVHDETPIHMEVDHISELAVRTELPQGSLSSPIVASKIMEGCLSQLSAKFVGVHGDNIVIGTKSVAEAQTILDTLAQLLQAEHLGAPLFLKYARALKMGEHVDILGYWPRPNPDYYGGGVRFSPSNQALKRFYVKLAAFLLPYLQSEWGDLAEKVAYTYAASFKNWGGRLGGREEIQAAFWEYLADPIYKANPKILNAIDAGFSKDKIMAMAGAYAISAIPDIVLIDTMGLKKELAL